LDWIHNKCCLPVCRLTHKNRTEQKQNRTETETEQNRTLLHQNDRPTGFLIGLLPLQNGKTGPAEQVASQKAELAANVPAVVDGIGKSEGGRGFRHHHDHHDGGRGFLVGTSRAVSSSSFIVVVVVVVIVIVIVIIIIGIIIGNFVVLFRNDGRLGGGPGLPCLRGRLRGRLL